MTAQITTLINKQDGFELVRDTIATILVEELANQQVLAVGEGEDPDDWKIRVFVERSSSFEQWLNEVTDTSPICNIWTDNFTFDRGRGNTVSRQTSNTIYNLDCYGFGQSASDGGSGHVPGDKKAAFEAARAVRLVRNILMSSFYTYASLRPTVGLRWVDSVTFFQPTFNDRTTVNVNAARIKLSVEHGEFSPQAAGELLSYISTVVDRADDGEFLFQVDKDFS